ncbi:hypothetical protein QKW60_07770 [Defluviimonas aestuarii]|uniref:hypothetical protein n=1 Tax=Albidovulum aestuarii TaxID=1130726 RepID=UPI00249CB516|nr:hypothetical protein [Defluviimonas aestuarii]MDI3336300.1 hypothetical protein [Defluviimonas aestuarii]
MSRMPYQNFTADSSTKESLSDLLITFKELFGNVRELRNVIQHHGEFVFGDMRAAKVRVSEIKRVGLPIDVHPGGSIGAISDFFYNDSLLVSSDQSGNLHEVYIGKDFPLRIAMVAAHFCEGVTKSGLVDLKLVSGLTELEVRQISNNNGW